MRKVINLNEGWRFGKSEDEMTPVRLPHTWNAEDGQDGGNDYYRGRCIYKRRLCADELPRADRYYLELCGANSSATVYVNDKKLAHHDGGYSRFRVNITDALSEDNEIRIEVDNSPRDDVYPQMADFTFYGGLYRDVRLIATGATHFDLDYYGSPGITVTPTVRGADADIDIRVFVTDKGQSDEIEYSIYNADGEIIKQARTSDERLCVTVEGVHLWRGRPDPYLYRAEARLMRGTEILDSVSTEFGCRYFSVDPERGFILNGEEYPLRGVSRHQDRRGIGNALLPRHHKEDIDLIMEMGANTVRLAHYQHDDYFYTLCDRCGLVVWAEIPYISKHLPKGTENTVSQMTELITQNYNHPSIFFWGLSNEITMGGSSPEIVENHKRLNDLVHELDPTRLSAVACVSMCKMDDPYVHISDVVAYNHYFGWYGGDTSMNGPWFDEFHKKYPTLPIGVSEYGCEALDWHTSNPTQGDYTEEYQAYYHEELIKQLFTRPYIFATYVWNMFDFGADARAEGGEDGMNHKGLVDFDRKYKKDAFYVYKAYLSDEPFVHICGKRYVDRVENPTRVTVYSNLDEVELYRNGSLVEKKKCPDHIFRFEIENDGRSNLEAKAGQYKDESVICKVDTPNEGYILKEKGAVLNWFDIDSPEGYLSLNDKISDILALGEGKRWFDRFLGTLERAKTKSGGFAGLEINDEMMKMMGSFTLLRMTTLLGMMDISFTKEQLLDMNKELNSIKK